MKSQLHETYDIFPSGNLSGIIFPPAPLESFSRVSSSPSVPRQGRFLSVDQNERGVMPVFLSRLRYFVCLRCQHLKTHPEQC